MLATSIVIIDLFNDFCCFLYFFPLVCPNVEGGSICEDSIFLRVCNSIRARNGGVVPRSCQVVRDEYTDIDHQPSADNP